jgi:hypothetical protein
MTWLDVIGWLGSALLVYSVMQARVLRFRVLNLAACVVLTGFNAALGIWPMVAMNIALCAINLWHVRRLVGTRHDEATYQVIAVPPEDAFLGHLLEVHGADVLRFQPDFHLDRGEPDLMAFLVLVGDSAVGIVLVRAVGGGTAQIVLDYVTPTYRDFSPGRFIFGRSHVLRAHGFTRVVSPPGMVSAYYERIGFTALPDGTYELSL